LVRALTVAVGDVHGCLDALTALLDACETITADNGAKFVFVGDYVDRGPDSQKVIDLLIRRQRAEPDRFICLGGNHEAMLVRAAATGRSDRDLMTWWGNGGEATLDSYGLNDPGDLPQDHLDWISSRPVSFPERHRLYVHAGIRPGVPIASQSPDDMLWIREPFLSSEADHGVFIVHGHTPTESGLPDLRFNRLNLDTGACFGGRLTAAVFSDDEVLPRLFVDSSGAVRRAVRT
jgi:diadenosine tetraphosphatase ApaH/serine/threonine PP2A family protein phosphatase